MDFKLYEKIIKEGEKIDWYGTEVPKGLINKKVIFVSENLHKEIDGLKSKLLNTRGSGFDKMEHYIKALENNLKNLPYSFNGDCYLKKKKMIEQSIKEKELKQTKTTKKKTRNKKKTKNSNIIFGNETK